MGPIGLMSPMSPIAATQKITCKRTSSASWCWYWLGGVLLVCTWSSNQLCSQLNCQRTFLFRYQLKPSVISVAPLLLRVGFTSWPAPGWNADSSTFNRDTRASTSHAPNDVNGEHGSNGRSGATGSLYAVRSSPVSSSVAVTWKPSKATSRSSADPCPFGL